MIRVRCQQHVTIDAKGRIALPAPIRHFLEAGSVAQLVFTYDPIGCVKVWLAEDFERRVETPLLERDPFARTVQDFAHSMMSTANDVEVDKQGRVRIPPVLRDLAALDKDCTVHVVLGVIEIWDRDAWGQRFQESVHAQRLRDQGMPRSGA